MWTTPARTIREIISLGITYAPMMDSEGRMTDIIASVRDLTRYREEEALQKHLFPSSAMELKTPVSIIKVTRARCASRTAIGPQRYGRNRWASSKKRQIISTS